MDYKPVVYACTTSQSGHVILRERDPAICLRLVGSPVLEWYLHRDQPYFPLHNNSRFLGNCPGNCTTLSVLIRECLILAVFQLLEWLALSHCN